MHYAFFRNRTKAGFTLIELLVVIAIIGILASIVLASLDAARQKARDARRLGELRQVQAALEIYYSDYGRYPPATNSYVGNITGLAPTYIPELPTDPIRVGSWNYRYYSSNYSIGYSILVNLETDDSATFCRFPAGSPGYSVWDTRYPICN